MTSHFDSPPNKPLRACVSKGCTLLPGLRPFSVHGHDRKYDGFVLQAYALFRTSPHFQFVSFHEDTTPPPRWNKQEYTARGCNLVRGSVLPALWTRLHPGTPVGVERHGHSALHTRHYTPYPTHTTRHPIHPAYTLHHTPCTIHPAPYTLHTPCIHPAYTTLDYTRPD